MARQQIMSARQVRRTVARLAFEVVERNRGSENILLFGVENRGVDLSAMIAKEISDAGRLPLSSLPLDTRPFRDDVPSLRTPAALSDETIEATGKDVVLVDDVLYTGRTARAAIAAILQFGRPASIQLLVLIDRGHREYPIRPDYVGRELPTKRGSRVVVEVEPSPAVYLED